MQSNQNIVQLRQLLAEKIQSFRAGHPASISSDEACVPTGLVAFDQLLGGGLTRGHITELVAEKPGAGGALFIAAFLRHLGAAHQIAALIDGQDSFDPCGFEKNILSRLLWVRCRHAEEALKAADLILRDSNLPIVLLDLGINPSYQLQKVSSSIWYRWQRVIERTGTTLLVISPRPIVVGAHSRLMLQRRLSLEALEGNEEQLAAQLTVELAHQRSRHLENDRQMGALG